IKQLFVAHGRPEFPGFFARAYEPAVRAGGVSWLGRDDAGQVVMHVGCFPRRFRFGTRDVVGGLLVNALVAESYRSFFPARALMRRARGDIEARGDIDFLYTDPRDTWFTFSQNGGGSAPTAGLLVRGPDPSGVATLHAIRREPELSLGYVIPGLVRTLRAAGCTRLQIVTVAESELAAELRRAGFLARRDAASVSAAPLTPAGEAVLGAVRQWEITDLDCDR